MQPIEYCSTLAPLLSVSNRKPLDVGCGRLSASISSYGYLLSINGPHPTAGFITLTPIPQFPNGQFYSSGFVRQYRRRLVELSEQPACGFGLRPRGNVLNTTIHLVDTTAPLFRYRLDHFEITSLFLAGENNEQAWLINQVAISNPGHVPAIFVYDIGGTLSMNRCSYGQLTEAGPIPLQPLENVLEVKANHLSLANRHLPARADLFVFDGPEPLPLSADLQTDAAPVSYSHTTRMSLPPGETRLITMMYLLTPSEKEPVAPTGTEIDRWITRARESLPQWKASGDQSAAYIIQRNIDYILSCCAVPVTDEHVCVITDHQLLPLAWNRDAYYMMQLLLQAEQQTEHLVEVSWQSVWREKIHHVIKGYLLWMFETAQRPHGYWGRAYLTTGYCKDDVFQLDQQCYPLLELCDYAMRFNDEELVKRLLPQINEILRMLMTYKDSHKWLFRTGETPADDKMAYPYHFSSQVLLWHTLKRVAHLNASMSFTPLDLAAWAEHVRQDCLEGFQTTYEGKALFAYLTDLHGHYQLYQDANDLPMVYAPVWGFCQSDDELWVHTMQFALSPHNKGGFYAGPFGGLSSVHTPHPWPLGDGQELLYGKVTGDQERYKRVLQKLKQVIQWDGLYSEAIDEETGRVESRHWFSWPGAFISTILLTVAFP